MKKSLPQLVISLFFIGLLFYLMRNDLPQIAQTLKQANPWLIVSGILLYLVSATLLARRLQLIYAAQETPIPLRESINITFVGFFFNNFLPTAVGGDLVKAYCGARITKERLKSLTSVLMDRIVGLLVFILIPSITIFFLAGTLDPLIPRTIIVLLVVAFLCLVFLFNRGVASRFGFLKPLLDRLKIGDKLVMLYDGLNAFRGHLRLIPQVSILSFVGQALSITTIYLFIRSLSADIQIVQVFLLTPVVHLMSMVPSINGLGVRETAFVYFFKGLIGIHNASALAILYLFLLFFVSVIGSVIYLVRHDYHLKWNQIMGTSQENTA